MDFDSILPQVGSFGPYQKFIICGVLLPAVIPCALHAYSQLFIAARPDHWCRVPELDSWVRDYPDVVRSATIPLELRDGTWRPSECLVFKRNYTEISQIWRTQGLQNETESFSGEVISCNSGWNYDSNIFRSTVIAEWNLVCEKDSYATVALVLFGVGGLIGNYVFGYLQDFWGRRPSFYAYLLLEIVACCMSAVAWNYASWVFFRTLVGVTVPAILASPYVLAIELVGPSKRVFCTIVSNIAYSMGLVFLAGIVYIFRDWRYLSLAVSLPLFLLFGCFSILPESPRWLVATGKFDEAAVIMKKIALTNGKVLPPDYDIFLRKRVEAAVESSPQMITYGIMDLLITPNMRKKTLIITFIWFANTSVYVGLSYYAPALGGNEIWNFFLAGLVELPTYIFLWPSLTFFGRRWILCVSMVVGGVACLTTFLVQQNHVILLVLYCIGKMGISSAFVVLPLAASELYPTVVRGLGMSVSSVIGMIGPIVIPIINYTGSNMLVLPLLIMGTLLCLGGFTSLLLPETKDQPLPQTIEDGEKVPLSWPITFLSKRQTQNKMAANSTIESP